MPQVALLAVGLSDEGWVFGDVVGVVPGAGVAAGVVVDVVAPGRSGGVVGAGHVYLRKNRQLKRPIQTMSTKCQ